MKVKLYLQAHKVIVLTDQPLRHILRMLEMSGHLIKLFIELEEFVFQYKLRQAIKDQALIDFIVECSFKSLIETFESSPLTTTSFAKLEALVEHPLMIPT